MANELAGSEMRLLAPNSDAVLKAASDCISGPGHEYEMESFALGRRGDPEGYGAMSSATDSRISDDTYRLQVRCIRCGVLVRVFVRLAARKQ